MPLNYVDILFSNGVNISSATGAPLNITGYIKVDILFPGLIQPVPILVTILKTSILTDEMPALIVQMPLRSRSQHCENAMV